MPGSFSDSTFGVDHAAWKANFFSDEWSIRNFQKGLPEVELGMLPFA